MTTKIVISYAAIHISYNISHYSYYAYYLFSKKKIAQNNFIYFVLFMDI